MADRPVLEKGQEIEVTPEMAEGGARILRDVFDAGSENAERTARDVFVAMIRAVPLGGAKA